MTVQVIDYIRSYPGAFSVKYSIRYLFPVLAVASLLWVTGCGDTSSPVAPETASAVNTTRQTHGRGGTGVAGRASSGSEGGVGPGATRRAAIGRGRRLAAGLRPRAWDGL